MRRPSPAINKCRDAAHQWILFMTERITPKTTEHNLIVRISKTEAEVTNNKRLRLSYCTAEAKLTTDRHEASRREAVHFIDLLQYNIVVCL